jgi:thiazole/oxazole-forming peptide maturase SagD family component
MKNLNLLLVSPWSYTKESVKFYLAGEVVEYNGLANELVNAIAEICNGEKNFNEVLEGLSKLDWERSDLERLLKSFIEQGILVNAAYVHSYFRKFTDNPTPFRSIISEEEIKKLMLEGEKSGIGYEKHPMRNSFVKKLAGQRISTREFGKKVISKKNLMKILWSLYGRYKVKEGSKVLPFNRTVPSGGALYPLNFSLILLRRCGDVKKGIYDVRIEENSVGLKLKKTNLKEVPKSFIDPYMLNNAQGVVVISADLERVSRKYGNRTTKYCYLEAGHSAQNMFLESSLNGVATCELGGFREKNIEKLLDIKNQEAVTAIIFGSFPKDQDSHKKDSIEVSWKDGSQYGISTEIAAGILSTKKNTRNSSSGKDKEISVALKKLASEVIEWNSWGFLPVTKAKMKDLNNAIHPLKILDYGSRDLSKRGVSPFKKDVLYEWVKGHSLETGKEFFVLADLVLYPYRSKHRYASANSSGCAAYFDKETAIKHALLELVERDAFMIWWLNRLDMPTITKDSLPEEYRRRIKVIEKLGYEIVVKDITLDLTPVIFIAARKGDEIFTCSQSSGESFEESLNKALGEMETTVVFYENYHKSKKIKLEDVKGPRDHGNLYRMPEFIKETSFVFETNNEVTFNNTSKHFDVRQILKEKGFDIIVIDATDYQPLIKNVEKRYVVKTIVPGLVPITFGYKMEPLGMKRINEISKILNLKKTKEVKELIPHPLD